MQLGVEFVSLPLLFTRKEVFLPFQALFKLSDLSLQFCLAFVLAHYYFYQDNYYKFHHLVSIVSPSYCYFVSSESLCHPGIFKFCFFLGCEILQYASVCYHCTVIYCVSFIYSSHFATTLFHHCFDHLLQAFVAAYSTYYYHFFRAAVAHRSFCDLYEHSEDGLLQGKAKIRKS